MKEPAGVGRRQGTSIHEKNEARGRTPGLEELRRRFEQFRSVNRSWTRLPEELWRAAAEIAARRGMNITARVLHLDSNNLRSKWERRWAALEPKRVIRNAVLPNTASAKSEEKAPEKKRGQHMDAMWASAFTSARTFDDT